MASTAQVATHSPVEVDITRMRHSADQAVDMLKVLANPERLLLLCQIAQGERCVSELEDVLQIRQPTLSQQLGVLRRAGIVDTRRASKQIYYRVTSPQALALIDRLYSLYCADLSGAGCTGTATT
ncbi:metalloregulator ArsR/SmtB family transcription factor [Burkholderiaceae bacterium DAT-1]|nr:metalloregulator ArsR/SmtB family transcription factor [Burkholderiaceae bacterium DAT-1]